MSGPRNRKISKSDKLLLSVFVAPKKQEKAKKLVKETGRKVDHILKDRKLK
jgi:hypothetical protein